LRRALDAGLARAEAARTGGVTDWTIRRWQQRRQETGTVAAAPRLGRRRYIGLQAEAVLREQVRASRRHTGRALCLLGCRAGPPRQRSHHVAGGPADRAAAQTVGVVLTSALL